MKNIALATRRDIKQLVKESAEDRQHDRQKVLVKLSKKDQKIAALKFESQIDAAKLELELANLHQRRRTALEDGLSYMPAQSTYSQPPAALMMALAPQAETTSLMPRQQRNS